MESSCGSEMSLEGAFGRRFAVPSVTNTGRRGRERTHPSALARPLASPAVGPQSGAGGARRSALLGDRPAPCAELCPVGATSRGFQGLRESLASVLTGDLDRKGVDFSCHRRKT